METATWIIAGASLLNAFVLAVYAWFTWGIWRETERNARQTQELVSQSRADFKLHVLATYSQGRCAAMALGTPETRTDARIEAELWLLEGLLEKAFPTEWKEINLHKEKMAKERGPIVVNRS